MSRLADKPIYSTGFPEQPYIICVFGSSVDNNEIVMAMTQVMQQEHVDKINSMDDILTIIDAVDRLFAITPIKADEHKGDPVWTSDYVVTSKDREKMLVHFYTSDPREMINFLESKKQSEGVEPPKELLDLLGLSN